MHRQHRLGRVQRSLRWLLVTAPLALALGAEDGCSSTATPPAETIGTTSQAESIDSFGLGEGRSGALSVTVAGTVVNTYAEILTTSASQVTVGPLQGASAPFAPGDLVMIWRTTGLTAVTTSQAVFNLGTDVAGYEFGRVKSVSGSTLTFTNPLGSVSRYATGSQVIRVPEYTTVTIAAGAGVVPYAWDGTCGGAVVFLATGAVTSDGSVAADSAGFRGGGLENATSVVVAPGCTAHDGSDESASCGGAHKGEGLDPAAYALPVVPSGGDMLATYGNGNYANGGGGGEARNAGGGGGGHFGLGGTGGDTALLDGSRAVGGYGGAPLSYVPGSGFVSLGGGGGAGDEDHGTGTPGGSGGGVVFIRAASIAGTGTFTAQGATIAGTAGTDGSGGGGAGGAVFLFSAGAVACTIASANGGAGRFRGLGARWARRRRRGRRRLHRVVEHPVLGDRRRRREREDGRRQHARGCLRRDGGAGRPGQPGGRRCVRQRGVHPRAPRREPLRRLRRRRRLSGVAGLRHDEELLRAVHRHRAGELHRNDVGVLDDGDRQRLRRLQRKPGEHDGDGALSRRERAQVRHVWRVGRHVRGLPDGG